MCLAVNTCSSFTWAACMAELPSYLADGSIFLRRRGLIILRLRTGR